MQFSPTPSCSRNGLTEKTKRKTNIRWKRSLLGAVKWKVIPENALTDTANKQKCIFYPTSGNTIDDHQTPLRDCKQLES